MIQFPGKLGLLSRCEHTNVVADIIVHFTATASYELSR